MDGRAHSGMQWYALGRFGIRHIDRIAVEPGCDRFFKDNPAHFETHYKDRLFKIALLHHDVRVIFLVGHDDCLGYPVSKEEHMAAITKGVNLISEWDFPITEKITIVGLWAYEIDPETEEWEATLVAHKEINV